MQPDQFMRNLIIVLMFALSLHPLLLLAEEPGRQPLFKIERSKNANILQYDAQIDPDGSLNKKKPVVVYWVRLAEQGQTKKLNWIQRVFAYGFKTKHDPSSDSVSLYMAADIGQPIKVQRVRGVYRATVIINDQLTVLDKIFVQSSGNGISTKVEYIELFGSYADSGQIIQERLSPCRKNSKSFCKPRTRTEGDR